MDDENGVQWLPYQDAREATADLVRVVDAMSRQQLEMAKQFNDMCSAVTAIQDEIEGIVTAVEVTQSDIAEIRRELAAMKRRNALRVAS